MPTLTLRALVTGAAGTVGGAIADRLEADGLHVCRTDLDGEGLDVVGDLTRAADVELICQHVDDALGGVDVLVNAAATYGERVPFLDSDADAWWRVLQTNVGGGATLCRRLVPGMVQRGRGHVVNIVSRAAVWDDPGQSSVAYSTSKAALVRFTDGLAAELMGTGVTVLGVSPGMVRSGMTASRPDIDTIPADQFLPASRCAQTIATLVQGGHEELHGSFVHATDDLDELQRRLSEHPRARTLSLIPYGDDDPLA